MDDDNSDIKQLLQEIAQLRARLDLAELASLKTRKGLCVLEETSRTEIIKMQTRVVHLDKVVAEIQEFIWPVVDKVFPGLLPDYVNVGERFKSGKPADKAN